MISVSKKKLALAAKRHGTRITITWNHWPNGKPDADATSGEIAATVEKPVSRKSFTTKAFVHFVAPTLCGPRTFGEIQSGDCIAEFAIPFVQIDDSGDTSYTDGDVAMEYDVTQANRGLAEGDDPASYAEVRIRTLDDVTVTIDGETWVQKQISQNLAAIWDAIFAGVKMSQCVLLRRAT